MKKDDKSIFAQALADVFIPELLSYEDEFNSDEEHQFSSDFENKMSRIIKIQKRSRKKIVLRCMRRIACVALAFLAVFGTARTAIKADKGSLFNISIDSAPSFDNIEFAVPKSAPDYIEKLYTIDFPEGFSRYDKYCLPYKKGSAITIECYASDDDPDNMITLSQFAMRAYKSVFDNENAQKKYHSDKNGIDYYIYYWNYNGKDATYILWTYDEYIFELSSFFDKNRTLELCKTLKFKEF